MTITNQLVNESFSINYSKLSLTKRMAEQEALDKVLDFCKDIGETVCYDEQLMETEAETDVLLYELLYGIKCGIRGKRKEGGVNNEIHQNAGLRE